MGIAPRNFMMISWHAKFLKAAIVYNAVVFMTFFTAYSFMDFNEHFESATPVTSRGKLYFAVMTHAAGSANDIVPKTDVARVVQGLHVVLAWMQLLLVFLS